MLFITNVPSWERVLRAMMSVVLLLFAYQNRDSSYLGVALGVMGATLAISALVDYCPVCAIAGRTFDRSR